MQLTVVKSLTASAIFKEFEAAQRNGSEVTPAAYVFDNRFRVEEAVNTLMLVCHTAAAGSGWWHTRKAYGMPYEDKERNFGELVALVHSELSEALEAARKGLQSDHITEFSGVEEELADAIIRICDIAGARNLRLGTALAAKLIYNMQREDHKLENREKDGGKKF